MRQLAPGIAAAHARYPVGGVAAALTVATSVTAGILVAHAPGLALVGPAAVVAVVGLTVSPGYWALAAVIAAVCSRTFVAAGVLPEHFAYADLGLAWFGFLFAVSTTRTWSSLARKTTLGVALVGVAVAISGMLAGSDPLRWIISYALLGAPFALIATLLLVPPSPALRRLSLGAVLALAFVQVPFTLVQAMRFTDVDAVQGTFIGSDAGAHLAGGIAAVAALWLVGRGSKARYLVAAALLLIVPFLSSAKQVIFAMPAAVVASRAATRLATWLRISVVVGSVAILVSSPALNQTYSLRSIDALLSGQSGKVEAATAVGRELLSSPATLLFGAGPAETVSHAALLTLDPLQDINSPVAALGLEVAPMQMELGAFRTFSGSFEHPASSGVGVIGDLGVLGALPYFGLLAVLARATWRRKTPDAAGATAALALFGVLGFVFTWWEQTGFAFYVAFLVGLSLAGDAAGGAEGGRSTRSVIPDETPSGRNAHPKAAGHPRGALIG